MATPPADQIEYLREALESGDRGGHTRDRELLLAFSDQLQLLAAEYSDHRHIKLLRHCTRMAEEVEADGPVLAPALGDRDAAEPIVRWIHSAYDNPETNRDYRVALRAFGRHAPDAGEVETDDNDVPVSLGWVSSKTPNSYDPAPDPAELLDWDSVDELIEAARNPRDAAMVALMMDAGPRGGEFFDLEVGDVSDGEHGLLLRVDGKTGQRSVTLIPSVPHVNRWLADHPGEGSAPLWSKLANPEPITKSRVYQILERLAERASLDTDRTPVTPTNFRKSNASWLARTGANAALIEERQGRTRGSKAVARYVSRFGEDSEHSAYARIHGRDVEEETPERRDVVDCPRCDKENPPDLDKCMWCGQGLDPQGVADAESTEQTAREAIAGLDAEAAERLVDALNTVEQHPELRAAFHAAADE